MTNFCQLQLTCKGQAEADKIAHVLLEKKLIACAKYVPVKSDFHWLGKIDSADEVLLVMESRLDLFEKVEAEVGKLHSYDTFVLTANKIEKVSKEAAGWLNESLGGKI